MPLSNRTGRIVRLLTVLNGCLVLGLAMAHAVPAKPNILLIFADDVGWSDIGCYGGEIQTPTLDSLAQGGLRFTQFYNGARCCPSRASLLTGLYPHEAGVGNMTTDQGAGNPGYRGTLQPDCVTLAEVLHDAGYGTYMVGKWHLYNRADVKPTDRGFDEFYGMLGGFNSCWEEHPFYTRWPEGRPTRSYTSAKGGQPGTFYATDAFADYSLDFVNLARKDKKPFFLYLAFNAAHFPLHAPERDIEKYEAMYFEKGWDRIRSERLARQKSFGLVPAELELTPRSPVPSKSHAKPSSYAGQDNPAWDSLPEDRRRDLARRMAVYAAMVDRMDQAIGRVINDLKANGELANTLVLFLSDNGACWEWDPYGFDEFSGPRNVLHTGDKLKQIGGPASYVSYGSAWANAGNTPWRYYKHFSHEGGIRTPLIVHWPEGMKGRNGMRTQVGHLIDIMPTIVEVAGANYPAERNDVKILPMQGRSLLPALEDKPIARTEPLFWEHDGSRAVRDGDLKLVSVVGDEWELYNLAADPTEMHDISNEMPDKVHELANKWLAWAKRSNVNIRTNPFGARERRSATRANQAASPAVANRPLSIHCDVVTEANDGVILAQGGREYGYSLHLAGGKPIFSVRIDGNIFAVSSPQPAHGKFDIQARLERDGTMELAVNGVEMAKGKASGLIPSQPLDELSIGEDTESNVGDYAAPNPLNGTVDNVKITAE